MVKHVTGLQRYWVGVSSAGNSVAAIVPAPPPAPPANWLQANIAPSISLVARASRKDAPPKSGAPQLLVCLLDRSLRQTGSTSCLLLPSADHNEKIRQQTIKKKTNQALHSPYKPRRRTYNRTATPTPVSLTTSLFKTFVAVHSTSGRYESQTKNTPHVHIVRTVRRSG